MLTDDDRRLLRVAYDEAKAGFDETLFRASGAVAESLLCELSRPEKAKRRDPL